MTAELASRPGLRDRFGSFVGRFRLIHLVPVLILLVLGAWSLASPIGAAPDDDFHLTSTWCANAERTDLCEPGPAVDERIVAPAVLLAPCFSQDPEVSAACQDDYLGLGSEPSVTTHRGSFQNNYPPLFYAVMNIFAGPDLLGSGLLMRLFNILLFVAFSTALYVLVPRDLRPSLVWGWMISVVPLGLFLIPSNNPSSWAIMGVGFSWLALLAFTRTAGRTKVALGVIFALTALMAAGARGDSAIYSVLGAVVVAVLTFRLDRRWFLDAILPTVMAVVAVLFFLSSRQSSVASVGLGDGQVPSVITDAFARLAYNLMNVQSLWAGVFGSWGLGWLDTGMPAVVSLGGLAVFIAVAFLGIGIHARRKTGVVIGLALVLWILPAYVLVQGLNVVGENVQPRYLLPLIVLFAGVVVLGVAGRDIRLGGVQKFFIVLTLAIAQSLAIHTNMRRYITGIDVQSANLNSGIEWWWDAAPSPMAVWIIASLAFTALITILVREMTKPHAIAA